MKKNITKKINQNIIIAVIFGLTLVVIAILFLFLKDKNNDDVLNTLFTNFIIGMFSITIMGSMVYSILILKYDLYYQLAFGNTRKEVYKKYLRTIAFIVLVIIAYVVYIWVILLIFTNFNNSIEFIKNINLLNYLSVYFVLNMLYFSLGSYSIKHFDICLYVSVGVFGIIIMYNINVNYSWIVLTIIGLLYLFLNSLKIKKMKI